ncbi:MAG: hypothetical protein Q8R08_04365 [bacterium]|nr:hypothetical protein [bacterium]
MAGKRTHIVIPEALAAEIDLVVGKRGRSRFLTEMAAAELKRIRALQALGEASRVFKDENHPEWKNGSAAWVRKMRRESERRFQKIMRQSRG